MTTPDDPAANLEHVVDDDPADDVDWAAEQLLAGRVIEDVEAELVSTGWDPAAAADVVETARQATRAARGVVTREDVSAFVDRHYRRSMRFTSMLGRVVGLFGLLSSMRVRKRLAEVAAKKKIADGG